MSKFGDHIRARREALKTSQDGFGLRPFAARVGISAPYLSRLENGHQEPPSPEVIEAMASELGENPDVLFALAGKVSPRLIEIIAANPKLFAQCIETIAKRPSVMADALEQLDLLPDHAIVRVVREVRDGDW